MLRTRLASLALAAGLFPLTGCLGSWWGNNCCCPAPAPCCASSPGCCGSPCCGSPEVAGFGGVVGTPCCTAHSGPPGAVEGPILLPQAPMAPAFPVAPPTGEPGGLAPAPNPRLVPFPQAPATPYTP